MIDKKISRKVVLFFAFLFLIQFVLTIRPVTLYLYEMIGKAHIYFTVLLSPLTALIFSLFIIEKLQWKWLRKKPFALGFILTIVIYIIIVALSYLLWGNYYYFREPAGLFNAISSPAYLPLFALAPLIKLIFGWSGKEMFALGLAITHTIFIPIYYGIIASYIGYLFGKLQEKYNYKTNPISIILTIFVTAVLVGETVFILRYKANKAIQAEQSKNAKEQALERSLKIAEKISTLRKMVPLKPTITSPINGSVQPGPKVTVYGKAFPGDEIILYINEPQTYNSCISGHQKGFTQADANGNFDMDIEYCINDYKIFVVARDPDTEILGQCLEKSNSSESVEFIISELHERCRR